MKKVLSVLAVAAIVTSAFAFATKGATTFCKRNAAGSACELLSGHHIETGTNNFKIYPAGTGQWSGTESACLNAGTGLCSQDIRLVED